MSPIMQFLLKHLKNRTTSETSNVGENTVYVDGALNSNHRIASRRLYCTAYYNYTYFNYSCTVYSRQQSVLCFGPHSYFNQPSILRNVPEVFLVLGVLTVILQTLGILLLRLPNEDDEVSTAQSRFPLSDSQASLSNWIPK